jgi:hypothetical protein
MTVVEKFNYLFHLLIRMKLNYSLKFIWGVILIVLSLIIGGITKVVFILYLNNKSIAITMAALYIISWPMLVLGVWWVGKEYAESIQRYFRYKYYHKYVTAGAKKVVHTSQAVGTKAREKGNLLRNNVKVKINSEREKMRSRRKAVIIRK